MIKLRLLCRNIAVSSAGMVIQQPIINANAGNSRNSRFPTIKIAGSLAPHAKEMTFSWKSEGNNKM